MEDETTEYLSTARKRKDAVDSIQMRDAAYPVSFLENT